MDDGRIEFAMQLAYRIAELREDLRCKLKRWVAFVNGFLQCFSSDAFHHDNELVIAHVALEDIWQVLEPKAISLGFVNALVSGSQAEPLFDELADERPAFGSVSDEVNALGDLDERFLQYGIDAITAFALQRFQMLCEFVVLHETYGIRLVWHGAAAKGYT